MKARRRRAGRAGCSRLNVELLEDRRLLAAIISEFMASNDSTLSDEDGDFGDWIELNNPTGSTVDLTGWYLTDDPGEPDKWQFPAVALDPGEFLVVFASDKDRRDPDSQLHANFRLSSSGDNVLLVMPDGETIAHGFEDYPEQFTDVSYGIPALGVSNPLVSEGADVRYHVPTPGDAGLVPEPGVSEGWTAADFDDSAWTDSFALNDTSVAITEVFTGETDWIELMNVSGQTVDTTGWTVLVNSTSGGNVNDVNSVSWNLPDSMTAGEVLYRTDDVGDNYWGSDIDWDNGDGWAMILNQQGGIEDFVAWGYGDTEIADIRFDFGALTDITVGTEWFGPGTNGTNNPDNSVPLDLIDIDHVWSYEQSNTNLGTAWRGVGYNDAAWPTGRALLYVEGAALPAPKNTALTLGATTYYFRSHFQLDAAPETVAQLEAFTVLDDGAVVYVNGTEVLRVGMPAGAIQHSTFAGRTTGDATYEGPFTIPAGVLVEGDNVIAVEVHQVNATSSDIVMGLELDATVIVPLIQRIGNTDSNTTDDFVASLVDSKGVRNANLTVPFVGAEAAARTGIGFSDANPDFDAIVATDVGQQMAGVNSSLWTRIDFEVENAAVYEELTLRMKYDDGFVAYLNGAEIARRNAPDPLTHDSAASAERLNADALTYEQIDVSGHLDSLLTGANVLAIHALNLSAGDVDLLLVPELTAVGNQTTLYFNVPTPGAVNDTSITDVVQFSESSRTFTGSVQLELSSNVPEGIIRYTLDGSIPNQFSSTYLSPLNISNTTQVRAAVYDASNRPGPVVSESFIELDSSVLNVTSDLPLVIVDTFGGGMAGTSSPHTPNFLAVFEPEENGRSTLNSTIDVGTRAGIHIRGSSSAGFPKKNYRVEFWQDNANDDFDLSVLGMPSESDWILYGPNQYDRAIISNPLMYELSRQAGQWAARTEWVEVYLNTDGGPITSADYVGLYAFMENIKQGDDRVDVEDLTNGSTGPVQGGWIRKIDRGSPYVYPRPDDITSAQSSFIDSYVNQFQSALNGPNFTDPNVGYAAYVDVDSAIDHNLLNMLAMNVDAFRLSGYQFKTQDGKMEFGPNWDFDRALDSTDGRDNNPQSWNGTGDGTNYFTYGWWNRFFQDPNFWQSYIDRWQEWRQSLFSIENINATIDAMADETREAAPRDYARWSAARFGGFQGEIDHMKQWLATRIAWVDSRFVSPPNFSSPGGDITPGLQLSMNTSIGTIYYTLDGTDPRAFGGGIAPGAIRYTGPVSFSESTVVTARAHVTGSSRDGAFGGVSWSGPTEAIFYDEAPQVRITEIMYNPADPSPAEIAAGFLDSDDFEFLELRNIGPTEVDLDELRLTNGVDFDFSTGNVTTLAPGERVVVVSNEAAFQLRYGSQINVTGEFADLTQLANDGERIELEAALGQTIHDFSYDDAWYPTTDGDGFSLVIVDENGDLALWDQQEGWRPGDVLNGSPGTDDEGLVPGSVVINELVSDTTGPNGDWIELMNTTDQTIDIGGWFLSDDQDALTKFQIPEGTEIPPGGFAVFNENEHFGNAAHAGTETVFEFGRLGGRVVLSSLDMSTGGAGGYRESEGFDGTDTDASFGRYVNSAGYIDFVATATPTPGAANSDPRLSDVIFNEVLYNPVPNVDEFIELTNRGAAPVDLFDPAHPTNTWKFTEGVEFEFPEGVTLAPGEMILVVPIEPTVYRATYSVPAGVRIFGPYTGALDNSGELLELSRPGVPDVAPPAEVPYVVDERIRFNDRMPWPAIADGSGPSLARTEPSHWGNEPASWAAGTSGGTPGETNLLIDVTPPSAPSNLTVSLNDDGEPELSWTAADDPESGISLYNVYLNGALLGTSDTTDLVLALASFNEPPVFEVSAVNGDGLEGNRSESLGTELIAFQDGVLPTPAYGGTRDTVIRQAAPTSTAGATATVLEIDGDDPSGSAQDLWGLMRWDLSEVPEGSTVLGASITFNSVNEGGPYSAYQMRRDWVEGEATWQQYRNGQPWQTAGGMGGADRGTTPLGSFNFSTGLLSFSLNADGIALVQDWIDGTQPNFGFVLGDPSSTNGLDINSREIGVPTNRPKLSVSYVQSDPSEFPPTVVSVRPNGDRPDPQDLPAGRQPTGWTRQNSSMHSIVVTFSLDVDVPTDSVTLTYLGFDAPAEADVVVPLSQDQISVAGNRLIISFDDEEMAEGVYRLDLADTITDVLMGRRLDGDADRVEGGEFRFVRDQDSSLHKVTADWSGDGGVSIFDFTTFAYWFGQPVPVAPEYVNLDGDEGISIFDFTVFAENFARGVTFPVGLRDASVSSPAVGDAAFVSPLETRLAGDRSSDRPAIDRLLAVPLGDDLTAPIGWRIDPLRRAESPDPWHRFGERAAEDSDLERILDDIGEDVLRGR